MKIDLLPLGARFQWKGITYTKVGPMTASAESGGGSVFVPKHAALQPVPGEAPPQAPPSPKAKTLNTAKVMVAFEAYHQAALSLADEAGREVLEQARKHFLSELG
jgi:hypothetical protein